MNFLEIITKLFGNKAQKDMRAISPVVDQIKAAYEPLNEKTDMFEYQVITFVQSILELAGVDDEPTFTRSIIVNQQEMIQVLSQSAQYLSEDYITEKILTLLGDGDRIDEILKDIDDVNMSRFSAEETEEPEENPEDEEDEENPENEKDEEELEDEEDEEEDKKRKGKR